jgi:hypothetical protein
MGVINRLPFPRLGYFGMSRRNGFAFSHSMTIGAAGAIGSQDADSGVVAALGTAGLYTLTLPKAYRRLLKLTATVVTAVPGAATWVVQHVVTSNAVSTTGVITVQFFVASTGAAGNLANPSTVIFDIEVAS